MPLTDAYPSELSDAVNELSARVYDDDGLFEMVEGAPRLRDLTLVLIECSKYDGTLYLTAHDTPEDAAAYHDGQEEPEDWPVAVLVNVVTGDRYEHVTVASYETTFHLPGTSAEHDGGDPYRFPLCVIHASVDDPDDVDKVEQVLSLTWADDGTPQLHLRDEQRNLTGRRVVYVHGHGA